MNIHTDSASLEKSLFLFRDGKKIGFVPTMGALHEGHLSLVSNALDANDCVVVSIFVNPTQFDNASDLKKYPRNLQEDVSLLQKIKGKVLVYAPDKSDIYPGEVVSKQYRYGGIEFEMEGKHRKGHFDGVGTIVGLLLKIVKPNSAYFGEKDFQQLQIVKKLVQIEKLPVKIIGCPIVREKNGLAMSSRNRRLTPKQLEDATILYKTLQEVRRKFKPYSISQLNELVKERFLNSSLKLEYFEIANEKTLATAKYKRKGNTYRGFIAAHAGSVRLIDNMPLN
ncbi:pantoate--beta-alanine ligase [Ulvibacter sp. MAR_2010_11]|uniref:pantoate--beta-alanine ligase n=1 Tax=Ulvibacter sp. MAR_2010_11 TaxID=1250229 RepID=UPI000C2CC912|nr:pantoate--beta-alanine ligase [Ulvibacter sp. MAR_2010_11]PKA82725.1 pantoate--beta-alanine ligase [Ulvibacter sp. MAR_2010_11]